QNIPRFPTRRSSDLEKRQLHVVSGKGAKDRIVCLSPPAVAAIREHLQTSPTTNYLFKGRGDSHLSRQAIWQRIRTLGKKIDRKRSEEHTSELQSPYD